ncbi:MAG: hypothetical protein NXH73_08350 [Flavobacteriaceae bacterium]|nr:hypothetical protein [Flavobacteriaceae bacterium]
MKLKVIFFLVGCLTATAQQYLPMLEEGNEWSVDLYYEIFEPHPGEPGSFTITYQIAIGETVSINNNIYKSIEVDNGSTLECFLRE